MELLESGNMEDPALRPLLNNIYLQPASNLEILGIATATCLLSFFLCAMLCTIFRVWWPDLFCRSDTVDALRVIEVLERRYQLRRSLRNWANRFPRLRVRHGKSERIYRKRKYAGLESHVRMNAPAEDLNVKQRHRHHTYDPASYTVVLSSLSVPGPTLLSTEQDIISRLDKRLSLPSHDNPIVVYGPSCSGGAVPTTQRNAERGHKNSAEISFLPHRAASSC
ncbi:hypothetical protein GGS20DRAFT_378913 [Poronia punctata]|nr:hypothetical protein GGS20DRAFT_378913 [Poronia punctata]